MKKIFTAILILTLVLSSCTEEVKKNTNPLIEMKDGVETIWYPGKKTSKIPSRIRFTKKEDMGNGYFTIQKEKSCQVLFTIMVRKQVFGW